MADCSNVSAASYIALWWFQCNFVVTYVKEHAGGIGGRPMVTVPSAEKKL